MRDEQGGVKKHKPQKVSQGNSISTLKNRKSPFYLKVMRRREKKEIKTSKFIV